MTPLLATKLYLPSLRPNLISRPRLIEQLNAGLHHKLTLISAPAGFGKTTLLSTWLAGCECPVAWLSLDQEEHDPARFLTYLVAAMQTLAPTLGAGVMGALSSPQPPSLDPLLMDLLNELATVPTPFILVLDDYHVVDAHPIDQALTYLVEHLPPQMHLVIATREDPHLPLARWRARNQVTEVRARELRFTAAEVAAFLTEGMGLSLSEQDIAALEQRTEGWIAGMQLAALALQGHPNPTRFISAFTGSHRFVLDYLVEEVLGQQDAPVQAFLVRTAILDRLCGPLCDAMLLDPAGSGQAMLDYLDRANVFLVPLDDERQWYRYHHLFAEMLRLRLPRSIASLPAEAARQMQELHMRASAWYEAQGHDLAAFRHAAAAQDVECAERLMGGTGIPRHVPGAVTVLLDWLASLPTTVLDARPTLWWRYAGLLLVRGQTTGVEEKLQAAEAGLTGTAFDDQSRRLLIGRIAAARANLALTQYQAAAMLAQSRRALEYLPPDQLGLRANMHWTLGMASLWQGDRAAARDALTAALSLSQACGDGFTTLLATIGLGNVYEADTHLHLAAETYQHALHLAGEQPLQILHEAYLGLARICYTWNELDAAEQHARQSLHLAHQYECGIDRFVLGEVMLARLKLARGDVAGAAALLAQARQTAHQEHFVHRLPDVAAAQVLTFLCQGQLAAAAKTAQMHDLPLSQARVHLALGDSSAALAVLSTWRAQVEANGWADERLQVLVLQAVALAAQGDQDRAMDVLGDALTLAEPDGYIRLFVDAGPLMASLVAATAAKGVMPDYLGAVLAACSIEHQREPPPVPASVRSLIDPLSPREGEVLRLIARGCSDQEMSERLVVAVSTVKEHNRNIFRKLAVHRRTEAVARAHELGLF